MNIRDSENDRYMSTKKRRGNRLSLSLSFFRKFLVGGFKILYN